MSLRHTLALAMSGLVALVLALAVLLAIHEVRRSDRLAAEERLGRVVDQLASLAAASAEQRRQVLTAAGAEPSLAALLRGEPVDEDAVVETLASLRMPTDTNLPIQLWDLHGGPVFSDQPDRRAPEHGARPPVPLDTVPAYGSFHVEGGEVMYYSTAPVRDRDTVLGWIVQHRRIGNPSAAAEVQRLIGAESRIIFSYPGDSIWVTMGGGVVPAPVKRPPSDSTIHFTNETGARFLAQGAAIEGTPWTVIVEMPTAAIHAGSRAFLERMAVVGVLLVLLAMALAWLISRRLTGPLRELAVASDGLAAGDHTRRVTGPVQGDEVARVAAAFNAMAEQVAASHRALEARLEEARELARNLESADRAKSEFLATMSHEIRTPINAVLGLTELMELESTAPEAREDYVRRTRRAARQLAVLVDDVLDLARVESGGLRIEPVRGSVADVVEHVVGLLGEDARRKGVSVKVEVDPGLSFCADPQRVDQILLNLVGNAVKFTPDGGRVTVRARRATEPDAATIAGGSSGAGWVRIDVEDTGIGIDESELDRIFEPFVQAQTGYTREYGGTGLGLSISRRLARLMGGDVIAESRAGAGSRFSLLIPAESNAPTAA